MFQNTQKITSHVCFVSAKSQREKVFALWTLAAPGSRFLPASLIIGSSKRVGGGFRRTHEVPDLSPNSTLPAALKLREERKRDRVVKGGRDI